MRLLELKRLKRIKAERQASIAITDRVPDPADRLALRDPATLADHLDDTYKLRSHLQVIGDEMQQLMSRHWTRLSINLPPQCGKTRTAVEWGVFWWLCLNPSAHVVIGSYNERLALKRGKTIRRFVQSYGGRFGLKIEPGSSNQVDWSLQTGGGVRSVGVGGGITGDPADLLVIDDPVRSRRDADSLNIRDRVRDWYSADLFTRRSPGAPVLLVCTPWHIDDLRATLIQSGGTVDKGGQWRVVVMPALCTDPANDPLGRREGQPLPHPKVEEHDAAGALKHWHEARAGTNVRDWASLYQCDPAPEEGSLVTWDLLRERRCFERRDCSAPARVGVGVDPSGGGRDTAGVIAGYLGEDGRLMFTHDRSGVMSSSDWGRAACELAAETGADFIVYEANYGGDQCELVIRTSWAALRSEQPERFGSIAPYLRPVHSRRGKMLRAEPIAQQWKEDRCGTAAYLPDLESEWATWSPGSSSPGRIDASVHLAYELLPLPESGEASSDGAMMLSEANLLNWGR